MAKLLRNVHLWQELQESVAPVFFTGLTRLGRTSEVSGVIENARQAGMIALPMNLRISNDNWGNAESAMRYIEAHLQGVELKEDKNDSVVDLLRATKALADHCTHGALPFFASSPLDMGTTGEEVGRLLAGFGIDTKAYEAQLKTDNQLRKQLFSEAPPVDELLMDLYQEDIGLQVSHILDHHEPLKEARKLQSAVLSARADLVRAISSQGIFSVLNEFRTNHLGEEANMVVTVSSLHAPMDHGKSGEKGLVDQMMIDIKQGLYPHLKIIVDTGYLGKFHTELTQNFDPKNVHVLEPFTREQMVDLLPDWNEECRNMVYDATGGRPMEIKCIQRILGDTLPNPRTVESAILSSIAQLSQEPDKTPLGQEGFSLRNTINFLKSDPFFRTEDEKQDFMSLIDAQEKGVSQTSLLCSNIEIYVRLGLYEEHGGNIRIRGSMLRAILKVFKHLF